MKYLLLTILLIGCNPTKTETIIQNIPQEDTFEGLEINLYYFDVQYEEIGKYTDQSLIRSVEGETNNYYFKVEGECLGLSRINYFLPESDYAVDYETDWYLVKQVYFECH